MIKQFITQNVTSRWGGGGGNYVVFSPLEWHNWNISPIGILLDYTVIKFEPEDGNELAIKARGIDIVNQKIVYMHLDPNVYRTTNIYDSMIYDNNLDLGRYSVPVDEQGNVDICTAYLGNPNYDYGTIASANWDCNIKPYQFLNLDYFEDNTERFVTVDVRPSIITPGYINITLPITFTQSELSAHGRYDYTNPTGAGGSTSMNYVNSNTLKIYSAPLINNTTNSSTITVKVNNSGKIYTGTLTTYQKLLLQDGEDVYINAN